MSPEPDPTTLAIERAPVAGPRPRVSAAVVLIAGVAFLGLAIVKPWGGQELPAIARASNEAPAPSEPTASAATPRPRPSPIEIRPPRVITIPSEPFGAEVVGATVPRDAWGISTVVVPAGMRRFDVGGPGLAERWMPIDVAHGAAWNLALGGTAESWGDAVLALGATMPGNVTPRAVRIWRLDDDEVPREIAAVSVPGSVGRTQLWLPDPANSTAIGAWQAGTYRIDVTVGSRVVRLVMIVRGDLATSKGT